jgi:D-alanyl-D-alanine carboxypeptidase (penicillin-binding protein 5/6)
MSQTSPFRRLRLAVLGVVAVVAAVAFAAGADAQSKKKAAQPAPAAEAPKPAAVVPTSSPLALETTARQALIMDYNTGTILFEKNADERMPPSSMSKIMTAYMVFKAIKEGRLKLDDTFPVSERAWRIQGSKMFVTLGSRVAVEDLIRGMIIQSGNDACVVLAEGLAGSEDAFAERMNEEAKKLGLTGSNFKNASGWPDPDHYMTARDLTTLAVHLIKEFPEFYKYDSEMSFTYGKDEKGVPIKQGNRNPLLYKNLGADGLKTGHTDAAGYGLTASAIRDGRRVVMVLNGLPSMRGRAEESERLLEWAYREFANFKLVEAGQPVEKADVWLGDQPTVQLTAGKDFVVTMPKRARQQLKVTAVYDGPVPAPISKGQQVGKLVLSAPGINDIELPLVASESVGKLGFAGRITAAINYLLWGSGKN